MKNNDDNIIISTNNVDNYDNSHQQNLTDEQKLEYLTKLIADVDNQLETEQNKKVMIKEPKHF